jgi:hypothetical protein
MEVFKVKLLAILQNMDRKTINELHVDNLNVLLGWHGVAIGMLKNKGEKVVWWQQIVASIKPAPILQEVEQSAAPGSDVR